jgi:hypothetical protein
MVAALALCLGIAGPAWAQFADPMAEDYATHVIPFYKSDANWAAFLLDGGGARFLTYILLVNGNNNSLVHLDSIPCRGAQGGPCLRGTQTGTWLRYDTFNTVAATFGDSGMFGTAGTFRTNLYFFTARGDLRAELLRYGTPRHGCRHF